VDRVQSTSSFEKGFVYISNVKFITRRKSQRWDMKMLYKKYLVSTMQSSLRPLSMYTSSVIVNKVFKLYLCANKPYLPESFFIYHYVQISHETLYNWQFYNLQKVKTWHSYYWRQCMRLLLYRKRDLLW